MFLVNKNWCCDTKVVSSGCTPDLEHLTIKCRPFYCPREFSSVTLTVVYIHPKANCESALNDLSLIVSDCEKNDPDSLSCVLGDFNSANFSNVSPNYNQVITCPTRGDKTLDHCYCKMNSCYKSVERPAFGESDHSVVLLIPTYKTQLKQTKPVKTTVTLWPQSAVECLQDCFERTLWHVFDYQCDFSSYVDVVTDYLYFCQNVCLPTKTITQFPNNKPWFNKRIRSKIVEKDAAYRNRKVAPELFKQKKSELNKSILSAKLNQRDRVEEVFDSKDSKVLWSNLKLITHYKGPCTTVTSDDVTLPDQLNNFYARFDHNNKTKPEPRPAHEPPFVISEHEVRRSFSGLKVNKAAGPDNITPRLLRLCSSQLAPVFTDIFNTSLSLSIVPTCYKRATIVPVPKKNSISCLNDYRPVALTSVIMKCFEKLMLSFINNFLPKDFDNFQFAYRANRSIEDAININLHEVLNFLENKNSYARILFIDFSSAFNTIIPSTLYEKLADRLGFPLSLCNWILNFLLERSQVVKIGCNISSPLILNTGTPQGCPLSPKLFSIFTYDCKSSFSDNLIVKFADDTTVTGLISNNDESGYRAEVQEIVTWCGKNNLELNVSKTKEIIIDFRRKKNVIHPLIISDSRVEQVQSFKFLGTIVSEHLSWHLQCKEILKKAKQRMYFLRKLKTYGVKKSILLNFYRTIVESALTTSITVWFMHANKTDLHKLDAVVRMAERIIGTTVPSLHDMYVKRVRTRTKKIMFDHYHPANHYFDFLPSRRRLRTFKGNKRFTNSFFASAVKLFNSG